MDPNVSGDFNQTDDRRLMWSPMNTDIQLITFKIICTMIGLPLNVFVAVVILRLKRLRSKPRNIFLLGIILSNLTSHVPALSEIINFFYPDIVLCQVFIAFISLPDSYLLLNIFLSLMDRYVAIRYPLWHREKVTVRRVALWLSVAFALATLTNKWPHVALMVPITCELDITISRISGIMMTLLFLLCLVARVTVYVQTKNLLREHQQNLAYSFSQSVEMKEVIHRVENQCTCAMSDRVSSIVCVDSLGVRMSQQALRRMEVEATKTLLAGVTSLLVLTCPMVIYLVAINICRFFYFAARCNPYTWFATYLKHANLIQAIYHPVIYLIWNEEFASVIRRKR